ncbi:MAG: SoxR reducing system RseC family protein [Peptoniphilaceae bacterium]|uniref:SoxR reducing system RseC family protein n=1 Tax=Parvimonas sp. TaxID=1944660 RepID=UPI002A754E78|nr:SoxR reducing system RseC family protein [Parvimonas sp.]MDD7764678.1 SoxR reducing system RseC family protein [Peptoniphilaceae bacterium]MDY3050948.1 SoxR reducing system RseC family protein [Parvimonas sp.]
MEQIGYVTKLLDNNKCKILVSRISGCKGTCKTCSGCPTPSMHIVMDNLLDVSVGDYVKIGVDSKTVLKYSVFLYGLPILFFVLSILLLNIFFPNLKNIDLIGFSVGILMMTIAFMIVKFIDKKYAHISTKAMFMEQKISKKDLYS